MKEKTFLSWILELEWNAWATSRCIKKTKHCCDALNQAAIRLKFLEILCVIDRRWCSNLELKPAHECKIGNNKLNLSTIGGNSGGKTWRKSFFLNWILNFHQLRFQSCQNRNPPQINLETVACGATKLNELEHKRHFAWCVLIYFLRWAFWTGFSFACFLNSHLILELHSCAAFANLRIKTKMKPMIIMNVRWLFACIDLQKWL